jgi:asparagine synthetase B (glutamine-hydrolysing)
MIGLYGIYRAEPSAPADLTPLAATVSSHYACHGRSDTGATLGCATHIHDRGAAIVAESGWMAAAIGEIFNAADVLGGSGAPPPSLAVLALHLAREGRLDRLAHANGLFALALYERAAHRLILVTDRHASFPVHLWRSGQEAIFAGQIFTLLGDRRVPRKANPAALAQLFTTQRTFGRATSVAGIDALPAGTIVEIDGAGLRERRYRTLAWRKPDFSEREGAELLAAALRNAANRQAAGGLLLSGGLDSRLILAAAPRGSMSCWTTAGYDDNPELAIARDVAALCGAEHHTLLAAPPDTLPILEQTVIESNGLYPASTAMSVFLPRVGKACATIHTGHGLDFTLRGYYLPARFIEIGGSRTRTPSLRPIPIRPSGADVLAGMRQGPPRATVWRIAAAGWRDSWWNSQAQVLQETLAPWLESDEPYNAWDAFILHALSKHYAFTGMMATRAVGNLRMLAFDDEVFDVYLRMTPAWRCSGRMAKRALRTLSPDAARLPNANTHFAADMDPWLETGALLARGAFRRLGIARRLTAPTTIHSTGSWHDTPSLYRDEPAHRARFKDIRNRLDALTFGVLDRDALAACIDEHLDGRAKHTKLLRQLLTHDAWVRSFGIVGAG